MKFIPDDSGELRKLFESLIEKYRPELKKLRFIYGWRSKEKFQDGKLVLADVQKLSPKDRDLFGVDVRIIVCETNYPNSKRDRKKLAYHELCHIEMIFDEETGKIKRDKEKRICFKIVPHDLDIRRFDSELKIFGLDEGEDAIRRRLNTLYKKVKIKNE